MFTKMQDETNAEKWEEKCKDSIEFANKNGFGINILPTHTGSKIEIVGYFRELKGIKKFFKRMRGGKNG